MPEASNVAAVRRLLLASNRGDVDTFLDCLRPDVEWHSMGLFLHPAQLWRGHGALRQGLAARVVQHGGHPQVILREVEAREEQVMVVGAVSIPQARRPAILPAAWIFTFDDTRKVASTHTYTTEQLVRAEWAAG